MYFTLYWHLVSALSVEANVIYECSLTGKKTISAQITSGKGGEMFTACVNQVINHWYREKCSLPGLWVRLS